MSYDLDIIVPVYKEEGNIDKTLNEILKTQKINFRILVVFDFDEDPTLNVIKKKFQRKEIICLKNKYNGFNGAVKTAFENLDSNAIMLYPADDHENFDLIYKMYKKFEEGFDIVCASRFVEGGSYEGAPFIKRLIVKLVSFTLSNFTTLPTKDATNGFRLFSKKIVQEISIESKKGFTFSIELLAKAHRLNFKITELPEKWPVRKSGKSKFKYYTIFFYFKWFIYILLSNFKK
jgi:glycosyltransferase involved in cell wall biosynthesis